MNKPIYYEIFSWILIIIAFVVLLLIYKNNSLDSISGFFLIVAFVLIYFAGGISAIATIEHTKLAKLIESENK